MDPTVQAYRGTTQVSALCVWVWKGGWMHRLHVPIHATRKCGRISTVFGGSVEDAQVSFLFSIQSGSH